MLLQSLPIRDFTPSHITNLTKMIPRRSKDLRIQTHLLEHVQILLDAPRPVRAVPPRLGQRSPILPHLLGAQRIDVRVPTLDQFDGAVVNQFEVIRSVTYRTVPRIIIAPVILVLVLALGRRSGGGGPAAQVQGVRAEGSVRRDDRAQPGLQEVPGGCEEGRGGARQPSQARPRGRRVRREGGSRRERRQEGSFDLDDGGGDDEGPHQLQGCRREGASEGERRRRRRRCHRSHARGPHRGGNHGRAGSRRARFRRERPVGVGPAPPRAEGGSRGGREGTEGQEEEGQEGEGGGFIRRDDPIQGHGQGIIGSQGIQGGEGEGKSGQR
mmetsp:Transcript_29121/g.86215  ORF Transcript_29121/g.86215 Transcript_29121/m.86215 type:complete len:326 (-) Transcript_29121:1204-2181(-)